MYDGLANSLIDRLEKAIKLVYWSGFSDGAMFGFVAGFLVGALVTVLLVRR